MRARIDEVELTAPSTRCGGESSGSTLLQEEEPWKLSKDEAEADHLDQVLYALAEGLRVVSVLLHAFMPGSTERLLAALGRHGLSLDDARFGAVEGGAKISDLGQLFPRVEAETPVA